MQASSLLLLPDRSVCPLHLSAASDQALMEAVVFWFTDESKQTFMHPDGTYKDICKWRGVQCNGRRRVKNVDWGTNGNIAESFAGVIDFEALPPSTQSLSLIHASNTLMGTLDAITLPFDLRGCVIHRVGLNIPIDLRRLPPELKLFSVTMSAVRGTCCLSALPSTIIHLILRVNMLEGSITLDHLPNTLQMLDLSVPGVYLLAKVQNLTEKFFS